MPMLIPVVAAYAVSTAVTTIIGTSLLAGVLAAVAGAAAAAFVSKMMADGRSAQGSNVARGILIDATQSYGPVPVLYGSRRCGGLRTVTEVSNAAYNAATSAQLVINGASLSYAVPSIGAGFYADTGVTPFTSNDIGNPVYGVAFTKVGSSPGPGQYSVDGSGNYTFNAADSGTQVNIAYQFKTPSSVNALLNLVIVWCEGQIQGIDQLYLDDVAITDGRFNGLVYYENYLGTDTQAASPTLIATLGGKWTAKDTNSGFAYTYLQLTWNPDVFPRGMPVVTADLRGKLVYDPRDGTTKYSDNPALCLRDYLTNARYGWAADGSIIDDASFKDAAYFCDQQVSIPTATGTTTQARYVCRGLVDVDQKIIDNLNQLLSSCRGFLVFSGGQYKLRIDRDATVPGATLAFDFTTGSTAALDGAATALTCTRAGAATRVNPQGLIEAVAANTLRENYDPVTLVCKGLLIEEARTNLVTNSSALSAASWNKTNVTVTDAQALGPDGLLSLAKILITGTANPNVYNNDITATAQLYSATIDLLAGNVTEAGVQLFQNGIGGINQTAQILQGPGSISGSGTTLITVTGLSTTAPTRVALAPNAAVSAGPLNLYIKPHVSAPAVNDFIYAGWAQIEAGAFSTSRIPTSGGALTRQADVVTAAGIAAFFNAAGGSALVEFERDSYGYAEFNWPLDFSDATLGYGVGVYIYAAAGNQVPVLKVVDNSIVQAEINDGGPAVTAGAIVRAAIGFAANNFAVSTNGHAVGVDTSGTMPGSIDRLRLGAGGGDYLNGHLRKFGYIPRRISNAELQSLSSQTPFTLNEDNIIGGWKIALPQKRTRFNQVKAQFIDAANLWQPNVALESSATYLADDGNEILEAQIDLPFTPDVYRAHQIAMQVLKQSRSGIGVTLTATIAATQLEVGDVVPLTHSSPGWTSKYFRVEDVKLLSSDEVQLALSEYDGNVYSLNPLSYVEPAPSTNLPDPSAVGAPGTPSVTEVLYQTSGSAGVKSKATVAWVASADLLVQNGGRYEVQYQLVGATTWTTAANVSPSVLSQDVLDLAAGGYNFRVVAFNTAGRAAPSAIVTKQLLGLSAPPSNLTNFAVQSYSGQAKFTWDKLTAASDLDVLIGGRIFVRWSPRTVGVTWDYGSLVNPDGYPGDTSIAFGPLMTGTYMAKAMDSSGNVSVNEAVFVVTEALITGLTAIATVTESPAFTGAKTNIAAVDGGIQLDGTTLIDSMLTNIDTWGSIDSLGGIQGSGSYAFASKLDLGSTQPARLLSSIDSQAFSSDDLMDSRTDPIDSWGLIDGAIIEDAEVQLWVRHTNDDPNGGSPAWSAFEPLGLVGDYNYRGFDFRLDFATASATHNRKVTGLSVTAKH